MDHIPSPAIGSRPSLNVRLLCTSRSVPGRIRFGEFPSHFATAVLPNLEGETRSADDNLLILIQSWLYFHVASEFFGQEIDPTAFRNADVSGDPVLCSFALQQLRRDWVANQTLATSQEHQNTGSKCVHLLAQALYACERLEEENFGIRGLDLILISVRILLCTLAITLQAITTQPDVQHLVERLVLVPAYPAPANLDTFPFLLHMIGNGWCPIQIRYLLRSCCATTVCYFAGMKRGIHPAHPSHLECLDSDHCIANKLDEIHYSRSHVSKYCTCGPIVVNEDQMMEIIEQDGIPLIETQTMLTDSSSITLVKHHPKMTYTAISHVWADGLGNPSSNAMSRCQLERLLSQIRMMKSPEKRHEPIRLWIDTFCIPVLAAKQTAANSPAGNVDYNLQSRRRRDLKKKAIRMMTVIFTAADAVLALDSELQSTSFNEISFAELSARAHVCGWKGRAWTLQEGALAFKLGYQFKNGVLFTNEAQKTYNESMKIALWNRTFDEHFQLLRDCRQSWFLPSIGCHDPDRVHRLSARDVQFMEVWNSLLGKSTTKSDDFFEIVANLLDFDASHIRTLGTMSNMMKTMIFNQSKIPLDILCLPSGRPEGTNEMEFVLPERPRDISLSVESFKTYLSAPKYRFERNLFALNCIQGPTGYQVLISRLPIQQFCIRTSSRSRSNISHIEVTLATRLGDNAAYPKGVYLYFATLPSHLLLQDTKHYGACFAIQDETNKKLSMKYACSFTFKLCRPVSSCRMAQQYILHAKRVERDITVLVDLGHEIPAPGTRRPINLANVRDGISKRRLCIYSIGPFILLIALTFSVAYGVYAYVILLFLFPIYVPWLAVLALYIWSISGGSYYACIGSYTRYGSWKKTNSPFLYTFLMLRYFEDWVSSIIGTVGMILKMSRPSFFQRYRWNRSLEDMFYSDVKVDYRRRTLNGQVPDLYDFPSGEATTAPRIELQ